MATWWEGKPDLCYPRCSEAHKLRDLFKMGTSLHRTPLPVWLRVQWPSKRTWLGKDVLYDEIGGACLGRSGAARGQDGTVCSLRWCCISHHGSFP